jgi:hypothetical protein
MNFFAACLTFGLFPVRLALIALTDFLTMFLSLNTVSPLVAAAKPADNVALTSIVGIFSPF